MIGNVLRLYSQIFEAILSLMALAMSAVIASSPHQTISVDWLPWSPETLGAWLAGTGVVGLLVVALSRKIPALLALFALAALVVLTRGLFLSSYHFDGPEAMKSAGLLVVGALVAFVGAISFGSGTRR